MNVSFGRAVGDTFQIAVKNIPSVLGAAILWVLTIWVPYVNVGTTIALFYGMPLELSRGRVMNPLAIFDGKYRKYMGEFFACVGMMLVSIIPALCFMIVPGIIIAIGWMFAVLLLIDKEINPAEAMTLSTKYTYGYKWIIFFAGLVVSILLYVITIILMLLVNTIDVSVITYIIGVFVFGLCAAITVAFSGAMYRMLVLERDKPLPAELD